MAETSAHRPLHLAGGMLNLDVSLDAGLALS